MIATVKIRHKDKSTLRDNESVSRLILYPIVSMPTKPKTAAVRKAHSRR